MPNTPQSSISPTWHRTAAISHRLDALKITSDYDLLPLIWKEAQRQFDSLTQDEAASGDLLLSVFENALDLPATQLRDMHT